MDFIYKWILLLTICLPLSSRAVEISKADREILQRFWIYAREHRLEEKSVSERVVPIARFFMDTPYKGNTLDIPTKEFPVINLRELDCVTFVENVLALAYLPAYNKCATAAFVDNIIRLRYRNATIEDYTSRLHYSSDWLYEMQRQGLLSDLTRQAGGVPYRKEVCFMSQHYDRYPPLKADKKLVAKIKEIETAMNKRTYHHLPKDKINEACPEIKEGDVLLITTTIKGLDTSHLGFAVKKEGKTYLLHASSDGKRVMVSGQPLQEYMAGIPSQSGIMIARASGKTAQDLIGKK